jgi:hypothetical protein
MEETDEGNVMQRAFRLFDFRSIRETVSNVLLISTAYVSGVNLTPNVVDYNMPPRPNYGIVYESGIASRRGTGKSLSNLASS